MTNIFAEDITYLSFTEYTESGGIISDEEEGKIYIRKAEIIIDDIIGSYGTKQDLNQKTIFPVLGLGIPLEIKKACILMTNCLYRSKNKENNNKTIISETRRGNSVTYDTKFQDKYKLIHFCYNNEIYNYLKKFLKIDKTKTSSFFRT